MNGAKRIYRGEEFFEITVGGVRRSLPIVGVGNGLRIASFDMLGDTELVEGCAAELSTRMDPGYDVLAVPEAKAIALAHTISRLSARGGRYVVLRKSKKAYFKDCISVAVSSITTTAEQRLYLHGADLALVAGRRVSIVDDVISTGGTMNAAVELITKAGGAIHQIAAVLLEGDADVGSLEAQSAVPLVHLGAIPLFVDGGVG